nr:movement protein [Pepper mild mosaic virus]
MSRFGTQDKFVLWLFVGLNVLKFSFGVLSVQSLIKEACFVLILFILQSHWYYLVFEHFALLTSTRKFKEFTELVQMEYRAEKYLNSIPADVLTSRAQAYNVGKLQQLKDQIPKGKELYANARGILGAWKTQRNSIGRVLQGGEVHTYKHVPIGNLVAGKPVELSVPIVDPAKLPVDQEESDYNLVKESSKDEAKSVHVGAVEVILECFTSPDCNIYGGAMFVDTFHEDPKNAIRALFVTQLCGGTPPRCLFFPDTQVQLKRGINERFKLILATGNSDFKEGHSIASLKVNVASCGVSLTQRYKPTPFLETYAKKERANVIEYVGRYAAVIHRNNPFDPKELRKNGLSFKYGGKEVLTEKQPMQFVWEKGKEQTVTVGAKEPGNSEGNEMELAPEDDKPEISYMPAGRRHLVLPNKNIEVCPQ